MEDKNTLLILSTLQENFEKIFARFDEHDKRFDEYDKKFAEYDKRFDKHDKKFAEHDNDIKEIKASLQSIENIVTRIEYEHDRKIQIGLEQISMLTDKMDIMQESIDKINSKLLLN